MRCDGRVQARLAIEALRAGVPNSEAIHRLGCPDDRIDARFQSALDNLFDGSPSEGSLFDAPPSGENRFDALPSAANLFDAEASRKSRFDEPAPIERVFDAPPPGFVVAGGFGAGKSHLLGYLREAALRRGFVVSTVTVSKETPLSIPGVTYAAAMRNATLPGVNDDVVTLALGKLERIEGALQSLELWASTPDAAMAPIFRAVLHLLARTSDPELRHAIEAFLANGRPPLPPLRQALKDKRLRALFDLGPNAASVSAAELVRQRMRFMPQLFCAAGFAGWVVLLDEVELIGRYGPVQRALAYAEMAQWLGLDETTRIPCVFAVCAITDDYADAVINTKQDDQKLPERLRMRGTPRLAELARRAMLAIKAATKLRAPGDADLRRHEATIRECYAEAYGWAAPPAEIGARQANRTMRHHVRGWITQWDMMRLTGVRAGVVETVSMTDYTEDDRLTETPDGFNASA